MLKIFVSGVGANLVFVISALLKQYLIAESLSVVDFGAYGSLVALASFLVLLVPFPAYLNVMIHGFSALPNEFGTRKRLMLDARAEMIVLTVVLSAGIALVALSGLLITDATTIIGPVLLLFLSHYLTACLDLLLRMQQAHSYIAFFMMLRNVPSVLLLMSLAPISPVHVALVDCVSAILITACFISVPVLRVRRVCFFRSLRWRIEGEHFRLWLARLAQFANSSMLRLLLPLSYGAHDIGLFFFAIIAQLPCSLFLSVTTQIYGHTLARLQRGDWSTLFRTQLAFVFPNLIYVVFIAIVIQFWELFVGVMPKLAKFVEAGPLIPAVVTFGAVLASDCQEYLLRSRKKSGVLLAYSAASIIAQIACVALGVGSSLGLVSIIYFCAAVQALVLIVFSFYSFKKVIGIKNAEIF